MMPLINFGTRGAWKSSRYECWTLTVARLCGSTFVSGSGNSTRCSNRIWSFKSRGWIRRARYGTSVDIPASGTRSGRARSAGTGYRHRSRWPGSEPRWSSATRRLYAMGSLLRGSLWECTVMPEIRKAAHTIADRLTKNLLLFARVGDTTFPQRHDRRHSDGYRYPKAKPRHGGQGRPAT